MSTTISQTTITFTVLHRTDEPIADLHEALARSYDGHAVGAETNCVTIPIKDDKVEALLVSLGNDGLFFNDDLGVED